MADIERLEEVMSFIESHPELHNQGTWMARTAPASDIAATDGSRAVGVSALNLRYPELSRAECGSRGCIAGWAVHFWGDEEIACIGDGWSRDAAEILGLRRKEASILFWSKNTMADLRQMVKDLANGVDLTQAWEDTTVCEIDPDGDPVRVHYYRRVEGV